MSKSSKSVSGMGGGGGGLYKLMNVDNGGGGKILKLVDVNCEWLLIENTISSNG